jgi:hypothetical protein
VIPIEAGITIRTHYFQNSTESKAFVTARKSFGNRTHFERKMKLSFCWSCGTVIAILLFAGGQAMSRADDSAVSKELVAKGAKITDANGVATGIDVAELSQLSDDDWQNIAQLTHLQKLSFGRGLSNKQVAILTRLADVTSFTTNGADLDDEGVAQLSQFKKLQTLTFFHPGKNFKGAGLEKLAGLPNLENLTVAGSSEFANDGMSSIAKLPHLKSLRVWHINADSQGVASLKSLAGLTAITLGQRLSQKPPAMVADDTIGLLVSMKSLESVSLSESRLSLKALSQLQQLPSLKRLTLDGIEISEADVETLRKELPKVQLKWTAPTPDAEKRIKALLGAN